MPLAMKVIHQKLYIATEAPLIKGGAKPGPLWYIPSLVGDDLSVLSLLPDAIDRVLGEVIPQKGPLATCTWDSLGINWMKSNRNCRLYRCCFQHHWWRRWVEYCCFLSLNQDVMIKDWMPLTKLQTVIVGLDVLISKYLICTFLETLGPLPKSFSLCGNLLSYRNKKYKSRSHVSLHILKPQHKVSPGHYSLWSCRHCWSWPRHIFHFWKYTVLGFWKTFPKTFIFLIGPRQLV